uniref:Uncharacterized protein n=1 Tax=Ditylenchus dipsaci TaxID=166011 RepID=A0A915ERE9_9BILA
MTSVAYAKRASVSCAMSPSIMDVASSAGLLSLNPSDLVFETSQFGIAYYDYVLSTVELDDPVESGDCSQSPSSSSFPGCQLILAKLDSTTNVEWFETVRVTPEVLTKHGIPSNELAMITMGVLIWREKIGKSKLLCLVKDLSDDSSVALEALKRATNKFKCLHHVLTLGSRRNSGASSCCSNSSYRSSISSTSSEGMKLRIMMCQSRSEINEIPSYVLRDTKMLLVPSSNPLLCLCFPLT